MRKLIILGAGGHGRVIYDAALAMNKWQEIIFLDDNIELSKSNKYRVIGNISSLSQFSTKDFDVIVGVGDNKKREELIKLSKAEGFSIVTIIHPTACVSTSAQINYGTVIFAQTAINASAIIGIGCIINTGAVIEHDCVLEDYVHVSPNVALAGGVKIGQYSWIGIGSNVIEKIIIGSNVIVGAGAAVVNNLSDNVTSVGVPAKVIKNE